MGVVTVLDASNRVVARASNRIVGRAAQEDTYGITPVLRPSSAPASRQPSLTTAVPRGPRGCDSGLGVEARAGERRSYALLRPIADVAAQERIRDLVLQAFAEYEEAASEVAS